MSDVVVVQVGAKTAVGLNARQTGFLLRAGFPAMAEAPLANAAGEAITMGFVPTIDGGLVGAERLVALAQGPFEEAVEGVRGWGDLTADVYVGIDEACEDGGIARRGLEAMVRRGLPGVAGVKVEEKGEAAVAGFVPAAIQALETRRVNAVVIGGVHSDYDPRSIAALEASGRLFSRENLDSRIPGEAAAFFVLVRAGEAERRKISPMARVLGVGAGREQARPDNDHPAYEAFGMTAAVRQALKGLGGDGRDGPDGRTAGWVLTDLTGEMRRLHEWESVFVRAQKRLGRPYLIDSPAQRIGYLGAAAMPLFVAMAATAWGHGYAPSRIALAMAGNDGGDRAAMVLGQG